MAALRVGGVSMPRAESDVQTRRMQGVRKGVLLWDAVSEKVRRSSFHVGSVLLVTGLGNVFAGIGRQVIESSAWEVAVRGFELRVHQYAARSLAGKRGSGAQQKGLTTCNEDG